ncbi:MAG TPA: hypothetical protein VFB34_08870 [Chloroflexota bacterium]|nr:hypothetical protein [Chloroflexota bacterium]
MLSIAIALSLSAAVMHALWNGLLKPSGDPLALASTAAVASAAIWTPVALAAWALSGFPRIAPGAWALAISSAGLEMGYLIALSWAYTRGQLSSVYPIARGTGPLVAVFAGIVILGEHLTTPALIGVGLLLAGIWTVRQPQGKITDMLPALLTGLLIGAYSAIDSVGVHLTEPWLYGWLVWTMTACLVAGYRALQTKRIPEASVALADPTGRKTGVAGATLIGMLMTTTYLLILIAFRLAPLALVAPLRESSVVLAALWGIWKLGERERVWLRLAGAAAVAAGAALISV